MRFLPPYTQKLPVTKESSRLFFLSPLLFLSFWSSSWRRKIPNGLFYTSGFLTSSPPPPAGEAGIRRGGLLRMTCVFESKVLLLFDQFAARRSVENYLNMVLLGSSSTRSKSNFLNPKTCSQTGRVFSSFMGSRLSFQKVYNTIKEGLSLSSLPSFTSKLLNLKGLLLFVIPSAVEGSRPNYHIPAGSSRPRRVGGSSGWHAA